MTGQRQSNHRNLKFPKVRHEGEPSVFTCPDCQGTLFILRQGELVRFQCRIGHLYSSESMMEAQEENLERLMRSTVRALEEQAEHMSQMAEQIAKVADKGRRGGEYMSKSRSALQKAQQVRKLLMTEVKSSKAAASRSASL